VTIGDLRRATSGFPDALEIEIIVTTIDADGDEVEHSYDLESVTTGMDPDTAGECARFRCGD
jgi:hypothetical protein